MVRSIVVWQQVQVHDHLAISTLTAADTGYIILSTQSHRFFEYHSATMILVF